MRSVAVSVAATATSLVSADADVGTKYTDGSTIAIFNNGANTVFIGGADVTTANGYPLASGESIGWMLGIGEACYGIVAAATEEVRVLQGNRTRRGFK